ncbi:MAG: hypothetical protein WAM42_00655, partial [Candidatus Nitrosopolaris sp.]
SIPNSICFLIKSRLTGLIFCTRKAISRKFLKMKRYHLASIGHTILLVSVRFVSDVFGASHVFIDIIK